MPGGGGTQLLSRRVGRNRALDLVLTGRRVDAAEAYALGLVDRLVPAGTRPGGGPRPRREIARHSPVSLRAAKRAVRDGLEADLATGLAMEDQAWHEAAFSSDRREGIAAFNAKRTPRWPSWRVRPMTEVANPTLPLRAQLTRFVIAGGLSAIVDFGLLVLLMQLGLGHTPAKALSFVAGTTTAYLINRRWTFRVAHSHRRFLAVVLLYALTFALQVGLFSLLFTLLTPRDWIGWRSR